MLEGFSAMLAPYMASFKTILPILMIFAMNLILMLCVAYLGFRWFITRPVADPYYKAWREKGIFMGIQNGLKQIIFTSAQTLPDQFIKPSKFGKKEFPAFKHQGSPTYVGRVPFVIGHSETNATLDEDLVLYYNEKGEGLSAQQLLENLEKNVDGLYKKQFLYHCYNLLPNDNGQPPQICNHVQSASDKDLKDKFFEGVMDEQALGPRCIKCGSNEKMKAEIKTSPITQTLKNHITLDLDKVVKGLQNFTSGALEERRVMMAHLAGKEMKSDNFNALLKMGGVLIVVFLGAAIAYAIVSQSSSCTSLTSQLTSQLKNINPIPITNVTKSIGM